MLTPTQPPPARRVSAAAAAMAQAATGSNGQDDLFSGLLNEARTRVRQQMQPAQIEDPADEDLRIAEGLLSPLVDSYLASARREGVTITHEPDRLLRQIMDEIFGFGPLAPYLAEEQVEEIICNGPSDIWIIHASAAKKKTTAQFRTDVRINFVNRVARARAGGGWTRAIRRSTRACGTARACTPSWNCRRSMCRLP